MKVEIITTKYDGEGIPSWPNTADHRASWAQAKAELGQDASISAIARRAQDILIRSRMPAEDEIEQARRTR